MHSIVATQDKSIGVGDQIVWLEPLAMRCDVTWWVSLCSHHRRRVLTALLQSFGFVPFTFIFVVGYIGTDWVGKVHVAWDNRQDDDATV